MSCGGYRSLILQSALKYSEYSRSENAVRFMDFFRLQGVELTRWQSFSVPALSALGLESPLLGGHGLGMAGCRRPPRALFSLDAGGMLFRLVPLTQTVSGHACLMAPGSMRVPGRGRCSPAPCVGD